MSERPVMLAIEASQREGSVAIRLPDGGLEHESLRPKSRHDDDLLSAIDRLMRRHDLTPSSIGAVAVSIGPGGFTGLRIATATARMFAETLRAELLAVPSALVAAEACDLHRPIIVALSSKRGAAWCTRLRPSPTEWAIEAEPGLETAETLDLRGIEMVLADRFLPEAMRAVCESARIPIESPILRAEACLAVGERMCSAGLMTDPLSLNPLYPRAPEAVLKWRERGSGSRPVR